MYVLYKVDVKDHVVVLALFFFFGCNTQYITICQTETEPFLPRKRVIKVTKKNVTFSSGHHVRALALAVRTVTSTEF